VIATPAARRRIWKIRKTFKDYGDYINAGVLIAMKQGQSSGSQVA